MILFCKNCKHYNGNNMFAIDNECSHKSNIETVIGYDEYKYTYKQKAKEINLNNNCKNFEPTIWYSIKKLIFKRL